MVFVPKSVKTAIYRHLFKHGSLSIPETHRTCNLEMIKCIDEEGKITHPRNLYVNMVMKSMESRGFIKDTFAWRHHYFLLTPNGEKFIQRELDLGAEVRPDYCAK